MLDFVQKNKSVLGIAVVTLILLVGGVFLFSKPDTSSEKRVNQELLSPGNSYKTSGYSEGKYLEATSSAAVSLVEFGDYQCPACGVYNPMIKQILTDFSGKITFTFRNYPLPQHSNAKISSYAALAAGNQGKYWQMHDKLFELQNDWSIASDAKTIFIGYAKELGLNTDKFSKDIDSSEVKAIVERDYADGNTVKLSETPTYYLDGQKVKFNGNYDTFKSLIEKALAN